MEDIAKRLKETSAQCSAALDSWAKDKKSEKTREELQESVHELRKVASRLEIELAISERDEMSQKPIPIPAHRDAKKGGNKNDNRGNRAPKSDGGNNNKGKKPAPKKAAGGEG